MISSGLPVQVAIEPHHIHQVIVMDYRDCGAYKAILGKVETIA